ncbi:MAG: HAD family hydrolase [Vulcanimicrobiota bacterium]
MARKIPDIKAIIFDLGNVIIKVDPTPSLKKISSLTGFSQLEIEKRVLDEELITKHETGQIPSGNVMKSFREKLGNKVEIEKTTQLFQEFLKEPLIAPDFLSQLGLRYPLYLLSNTNKIHYEHFINSYPYQNIFKEVFLSYKIKHMKPDTRIFEFAINKISLKAHNLLFIDDSVKNVEAAVSMGIHGIHFESFNKLEERLRQLNIL